MKFPSISRRDFLTYSGATVAGVTLGEVGRRWLARADERASAWHPPKVETFATSVCRECPAACGIRVRLMDRVPVKLEGNPLCPISRGRLCAKGQAGIEAYFDPDRLVGPARRVGSRKDGRFEPISWAEAVQTLTTQIEKTRTAGRGIAAFAAEEHGPIGDSWGQFWTSIGGRAAWTLAPSSARLAPRLGALVGSGGEPIFDLEHATYVLSFGAPVVEDWLSSSIWIQRSYGRFRRGVSRSRGRLVHVEGRRSLTARKADEWLPVPVDRQAALVYGIASVLFREDRVQRSQLTSIVGNLTDFEREVISRYTPDNVAVTTGVPVVTLFRLARELVAASEPLVVVAADASPDLVDAVFALNAIIGAFDRTGGVFQLPTPRTSGSAPVSTTSELTRMAGGDAPGFVALRDASALRALSAPIDSASVFERCDFVVSFSPYLDEAASVADLLLPTHTPLESWQAVVPPIKDATEELACVRPAAAARLDTHGLVEALAAVAEKLGGEVAAGYTWKTDADLVRAELGRLWTLRRGTPYTNEFQTDWVQQLERGGWWVPSSATREEFEEMVLNAGGWVDPFNSPVGVRQRLTLRGGLTFVPPPAPVEPGTEAGTAPGGDVTVRLSAFIPLVVNLMGGPNQPVLFELLGQPESDPWRVWAELSPETAQKAGIEDGSTVRITSPTGSVDAMVIVAEGMAPDMVAVAYVPAIPQGGRWAHLLGEDVRRLWGRGDPAVPLNVSLARV